MLSDVWSENAAFFKEIDENSFKSTNTILWLKQELIYNKVTNALIIVTCCWWFEFGITSIHYRPNTA